MLYNGTVSKRKPIVIDISTIKDIQIIQDDTVLKRNTISKAVVGGIVAGGVGAVIGANMANQKTVVNTITLQIITNDIQHPIIKTDVYEKIATGDIPILKYATPAKILNDLEELIVIIDLINNEE
ncbi:MAG: hypothetical protein AB9856_01620 [Cellulosilyticaceae bacterium]